MYHKNIAAVNYELQNVLYLIKKKWWQHITQAFPKTGGQNGNSVLALENSVYHLFLLALEYICHFISDIYKI